MKVYSSDTKEKADRLADRLRKEIGGEISISKLVKRKEIKLRGFDESATTAEIKVALIDAGGGEDRDYEVRAIRRF